MGKKKMEIGGRIEKKKKKMGKSST